MLQLLLTMAILHLYDLNTGFQRRLHSRHQGSKYSVFRPKPLASNNQLTPSEKANNGSASQGISSVYESQKFITL
jgi:hypothetical protein